MHKHVLLVSFAALCASVSAAGATPPAPADGAIVEPVTYYGYGYRHHGFYYRHHCAYRHHYGYRHYRHRYYGYRY
jgi:hypothetical protein